MGEPLRFDHLMALSTPMGLYEHALLTEPRPEHGYCVDDVARGLVVTSRESSPSADVLELSRVYLRFLVAAQHDDGSCHNRRHLDGSWADATSTDDHWGRSIWALGTAAAWSTDLEVRVSALDAVITAMKGRSRHPRSMAYAALGAAEMLRVHPGHVGARRLLADAAAVVGRARPDPSWPWPVDQLTYANAVLPEALLAMGVALSDDRLVRESLDLLAWLLEQETRDGHLSVVPVAGWRAGETRPGYDQQPIEVAALAEACWRAWDLTGDATWSQALALCADWFAGSNDVGLAMVDRSTGGGYDGLHELGVNLNQGAESTLAVLATLQLAQRDPVSR